MKMIIVPVDDLRAVFLREHKDPVWSKFYRALKAKGEVTDVPDSPGDINQSPGEKSKKRKVRR